MTEQEIKDGAPDGATAHLVHQGKAYYLKHLHGRWLVWFDCDARSGWGEANQTAVKNNLHMIKPI